MYAKYPQQLNKDILMYSKVFTVIWGNIVQNENFYFWHFKYLLMLKLFIYFCT